jgi:hypothetical protein
MDCMTVRKTSEKSGLNMQDKFIATVSTVQLKEEDIKGACLHEGIP